MGRKFLRRSSLYTRKTDHNIEFSGRRLQIPSCQETLSQTSPRKTTGTIQSLLLSILLIAENPGFVTTNGGGNYNWGRLFFAYYFLMGCLRKISGPKQFWSRMEHFGPNGLGPVPNAQDFKQLRLLRDSLNET